MISLLESEKRFWKKSGYYVIEALRGPFSLVCIPVKYPDAGVLGVFVFEYRGLEPVPSKDFRNLKVQCHKLWVTRNKSQRWAETKRVHVE